jgi:hypothetical protein
MIYEDGFWITLIPTMTIIKTVFRGSGNRIMSCATQLRQLL